VTKENESHKATDGTEFKISSEQKESKLKESTGKDNDGPLQGEYDGLKACLTVLIIINDLHLFIFHLLASKCYPWTAFLCAIVA
jgi:hypothetical protein